MVSVKADNFDLKKIADSGQCFRLTETDEGSFTVLSGDRCLYARQEENETEFFCSEDEFEGYWKRYFDLDTDYSKFIETVDEGDAYLSEAAKIGRGIRILRQDLWEMLVSFLISQQNNITRIKRCIENICTRYGEEKISDKGTAYRAFPLPSALCGLPEDALMECNLGYRSKYVVRAARAVSENEIRLDEIGKMCRGDAFSELIKIYGVGKKVADCICLFALHHLDAFPVDTHISQVMGREYPDGFPFEKYRGFEGVIQQYIFYYELNRTKK